MTWNHAAEQFVESLSASTPTPGGGAAAAMSGAMGCALALMATGISLKRKQIPAQAKSLLMQNQHTLTLLCTQLKHFISQDAQAYEAYINAYKLPKEQPERASALQEALWQAALVPVNTASTCLETLQILVQLEPQISPVILSDIQCARHLLRSAVACCLENIRVNAEYITQPDRIEMLKQQMKIFSTALNL